MRYFRETELFISGGAQKKKPARVFLSSVTSNNNQHLWIYLLYLNFHQYLFVCLRAKNKVSSKRSCFLNGTLQRHGKVTERSRVPVRPFSRAHQKLLWATSVFLHRIWRFYECLTWSCLQTLQDLVTWPSDDRWREDG